jgi:hypothetical protein
MFTTTPVDMQPFRSKLDQISRPPTVSIALQPEWLVGAATVPLVTALVISRTLSHIMIQMGVASEEIFRGERLPVLLVAPPPLDDATSIHPTQEESSA